MKESLRRILTGTCAMAMIVTAGGLTGCGPKEPAGSKTESKEEEGTFKLTGDYDFGGETITIKSIWPTAWVLDKAPENDGEDLLLEWQEAVEKAYHCKLAVEPLTPSDTQNSLINRLMSGDKVADFFDCQRQDVEKMRLSGNYLVDLNTLASLNLKDEHYDKAVLEAETFDGKTYACVSDRPDVQAVYHVNMDLLKTLDLPDKDKLYDLVFEKKWNYEKFVEFCAAATKDLNGDGYMDNADQYGAALHGEALLTMLHNNGVNLIEKQADGTMKYTLNNQNAIDTINYIKDKLVTPGYVMPLQVETEYLRQFQDGKLLMVPGPYWYAYSNFKEVEFELGLVPVPLGSNGTDYSTINGSWRRMFCIPTTNSDPERAGAIIQAYTQLTSINNDLANQEIKDKTYAHDENAYKVYEMVSKLGFYEYAVYENGFGELMGIPSEGAFIPESSIAAILEAYQTKIIIIYYQFLNLI